MARRMGCNSQLGYKSSPNEKHFFFPKGEYQSTSQSGQSSSTHQEASNIKAAFDKLKSEGDVTKKQGKEYSSSPTPQSWGTPGGYDTPKQKVVEQPGGEVAVAGPGQ